MMICIVDKQKNMGVMQGINPFFLDYGINQFKWGHAYVKVQVRVETSTTGALLYQLLVLNSSVQGRKMHLHITDAAI